MRRNQSSLTAVGIAIVRAIESEKPEGVRICYDPYARQLVSGFLFHLVRFFDRLGYGELRGPGVMGFLMARERHIDECLLASTELFRRANTLTFAGCLKDSKAIEGSRIHGR